MNPQRSLLSTLIATCCLAGALLSQMPEGNAIVGTATFPGFPGVPGLFIVSGVGPAAPVTGLPAELTTDGNGAFVQGAWSLARRSSDGALIVGTITEPSAPTAGVLKVWVFHLDSAGAVIANRTQVVDLGTATTAATALVSVLPDDRILVFAGQNGGTLPTGAMAGTNRAVIDASGPVPQLTPLPTGAFHPTQAMGGFALAPSGDHGYLLLADAFPGSPGAGLSELWRIDGATNQECLIASWPGERAFGIECDDDGTVYVSASNPTLSQHVMHTVRPDGCNPATDSTVVSASNLIAWGLALDRAGGNFIAVGEEGTISLLDRSSGARTLVAFTPPNGWGILGQAAIVVNNVMESYGKSTDGANHYWFENFPNPGGQPTVGNSTFSFTVRSSPGLPISSILIMANQRASAQVTNFELLVDVATMVTKEIPVGLSSTEIVAVPNQPSLRGVEFTFQTVHVESSGSLAASRGLTLIVQ